MSETITVYTALKNADLACISAKTALKNYLNVDVISELKRYHVWQIKGKDLSINQIQDVLNDSYYLANPNKEDAWINNIPNQSQTTCYHLRVQSRESANDNYTQNKINHEFKTTIHSILNATLWCLFTHQEFSESNYTYLHDTVVKTTTQSKGLLVNPLYESYEFYHQQ